MFWNEELREDQRAAASHVGSHARLLAGPGTGKTLVLTRRAAYLVKVKGVSPKCIVALTFTRAAAFELRKRIKDVLEGDEPKLPQVSTLHSFALRQLLKNSNRMTSIPTPLRIADDWEERKIVLEDLKAILGCDLKGVRDKFNLLSADWQTLAIDKRGWKKQFPDPKFLGAWQEHRDVFGYTLRSELVYQLKRGLEQVEDFSLESDVHHLLVDEYQDLNQCDLAVVAAIRNLGAEVYAAGDDDQSIYGFRYAHPEGIRRFERDYTPSEPLELETCMRCDREIIDLSLFVANQDPRRLEKPLKPRPDADKGEVQIVRFADQAAEARGVASICRYLMEKGEYAPKDILILMRSDRYQAFSSVLRTALESHGVPVAVKGEGNLLDETEGRIFLSLLRLLAEKEDSLAIRTLLMLQGNSVGGKCYSALYDLARTEGESFSKVAWRAMTQPDSIPVLGKRISRGMHSIQEVLDKHGNRFGALPDLQSTEDLLQALKKLADDIIPNQDTSTRLMKHLEMVALETEVRDHIQLLRNLSSSLEDQEQELDSESVNIMTMHRAKGLTARGVIIIACEDEYIPGRELGDKQGDERRLLYVSLSRARSFLTVTYCDRRTGQQKHTGGTSGKSSRTLTRFLRNSRFVPIKGEVLMGRLRQ